MCPDIPLVKVYLHTFLVPWPIGIWGPLRDRRANRIICLLANINSIMNNNMPLDTIIITVTPESS